MVFFYKGHSSVGIAPLLQPQLQPSLGSRDNPSHTPSGLQLGWFSTVSSSGVHHHPCVFLLTVPPPLNVTPFTKLSPVALFKCSIRILSANRRIV